jgi:hypothetical protein
MSFENITPLVFLENFIFQQQEIYHPQASGTCLAVSQSISISSFGQKPDLTLRSPELLAGHRACLQELN